MLGILLILIAVFPCCYELFDRPKTYNFSRFKMEIEVFKASARKKETAYASSPTKFEVFDVKPEYFEFDPNTLPAPGWQRLGLSSRQVKVVKNYLVKGGRFYNKEDLKKIYSITETQYKGLEPYINIRNNGTTRMSSSSDRRLPAFKSEFGKKKPALPIIELNTADSAALDQLRGIGPAFAMRIIRFRTRLGGFHKKEQLKEVYGMDSLRYVQLQDQIRVDGSLIKRININTATFDQLKSHPYLSYKQINAMIQFRKQHGNYLSAEDLKRVLILDEEIIRKIEPYISFDP